MRLRAIGYWRSERDESPTLPDPRDYIDDTWDVDERRIVVDYLRHAKRARFFMGTSRCRLCGCRNGSAEQLDDRYIWPEGLAHYVDEHAVRLPPEFFAHVMARADRADAIERDDAWWRAAPPCGSSRTWTVGVLEVCAADNAVDTTLVTLARLLDPERSRLAHDQLRNAGIARLTYASAMEAEGLREELRAMGVVGSVSEERRNAPDELLG